MRNYHVIKISLSLFLLTGCQPHTNSSRSEIKTLRRFHLSSLVDSIFNEYAKENSVAPAYAIFLDKKTEGTQEFMITIAPFYEKVKNLYNTGAVNYFFIDDSIPVLIYTGLEDFVSCDSFAFSNSRKADPEIPRNGEFKYWDPIRRKVNLEKSWAYIKADTLSYIVKDVVPVYPFSKVRLQPPTVYFSVSDTAK